MSTVFADEVHFFSCKVCEMGKISVSNMGTGPVHSHMKDPSSEKLSKDSKNMKVLSSIKRDAFTHLAIPKDLPKSATSKETTKLRMLLKFLAAVLVTETLVLVKLPSSFETSFISGGYQ